MEDQQVPEVWKNQEVTIDLFGSDASTAETRIGVLREVNDKGIVIDTLGQEGHPSFYPWHAVRVVSPRRKGDQQRQAQQQTQQQNPYDIPPAIPQVRF